MYRSLQQEFQGDKVAKKADQIEIPKGATTERKRKDEEIVFRKEEHPKVEKQPEAPVVEIAQPAEVAVVEAEQPKPVEEPQPEPGIVKLKRRKLKAQNIR